jgi:hypothetical protein
MSCAEGGGTRAGGRAGGRAVRACRALTPLAGSCTPAGPPAQQHTGAQAAHPHAVERPRGCSRVRGSALGAATPSQSHHGARKPPRHPPRPPPRAPPSWPPPWRPGQRRRRRGRPRQRGHRHLRAPGGKGGSAAVGWWEGPIRSRVTSSRGGMLPVATAKGTGSAARGAELRSCAAAATAAPLRARPRRRPAPHAPAPTLEIRSISLLEAKNLANRDGQ